MLRSCVLPFAGLLAVCCPVAALGQARDPQQTEIRLLRPLSLQKTADMDFGNLAVTTGGTATIDPVSGGITVTGGLRRLGGTVSPARYIGAATRLSLIVIRSGSPTVLLRRTGGTETLTLSNLSLDGFFIRLVGEGTFQFAVGGQLTVPANAPDGTYVGQLEITAEYF